MGVWADKHLHWRKRFSSFSSAKDKHEGAAAAGVTGATGELREVRCRNTSEHHFTSHKISLGSRSHTQRNTSTVTVNLGTLRICLGFISHIYIDI